MNLQSVYLAIVLAPLIASVVAGLGGRLVGRAGAHSVTILGVGISFLLSVYVLKGILFDGVAPYNGTVYTWLVSDGLKLDVGFLIDHLSAMMMVVVTFVSLMVHIYTVGYMHEDPGYQRFFSYISLFTFAMLVLVMANNFMQLFFGWEAVGVVSYLLIGFWYTRPTAIAANLKAFLVNRVGDFGFVLGIAAVLTTPDPWITRPFSHMRTSSRVRRFISPRPSPGRRSRSPAFACSWAQWVSRPRCRCMSGCRTRWRVRRRSPP